MNAFLQGHFPLRFVEAGGRDYETYKSIEADGFKEMFESRCPRKTRRFWIFSWGEILPLPEPDLLQLLVDVGLALTVEGAEQSLPYILDQEIRMAVETSPSEGDDWWGFRIVPDRGGYSLEIVGSVGL